MLFGAPCHLGGCVQITLMSHHEKDVQVVEQSRDSSYLSMGAFSRVDKGTLCLLKGSGKASSRLDVGGIHWSLRSALGTCPVPLNQAGCQSHTAPMTDHLLYWKHNQAWVCLNLGEQSQGFL